MRSLFTFPDPVDELAARSVATGVFALTGLIIVGTAAGFTGAKWMVIPLALGFWARVHGLTSLMVCKPGMLWPDDPEFVSGFVDVCLHGLAAERP